MKYFIRRLLNALFSHIWLPNIVSSKEEIDVVIPIIRKDLEILPLCFEGIRACVNNSIRNIYIIAPDDEEIITFCKRQHAIFIPEKQVLGLSPKDINLKIQTSDGGIVDRSGWLFQQLIKLSGKVGTCDNYLCIDADHILIRPHTFINSFGKPVFYTSSECHTPYYQNIKKISSVHHFSLLSFVAHKMIFNKAQLLLLHTDLEQNNKCSWVEAIISGYDRTEGAGFSEFELYGNFIKTKILRPWKQLALSYQSLDTYDNLKKKYCKNYCSLTFSDYNKYGDK